MCVFMTIWYWIITWCSLPSLSTPQLPVVICIKVSVSHGLFLVHAEISFGLILVQLMFRQSF